MLHTFCAYCWEYFARNLHVCNLLFNVNLQLGICAEYAQHKIYIFCIYAKYVQNTKYAECMHFAHMHSARMLHMCIVHIIIMRFAHMLYICQLHASFIYALCFNDIIINYVMHNNAQNIHSNIVSTLHKYFYRSFCSFWHIKWKLDMSASGCSSQGNPK